MVLHFGHDITTASPGWSAAMSCVVLIGFNNWLAPPLAEPFSCAIPVNGMASPRPTARLAAINRLFTMLTFFITWFWFCERFIPLSHLKLEAGAGRTAPPRLSKGSQSLLTSSVMERKEVTIITGPERNRSRYFPRAGPA